MVRVVLGKAGRATQGPLDPMAAKRRDDHRPHRELNTPGNGTVPTSVPWGRGSTGIGWFGQSKDNVQYQEPRPKTGSAMFVLSSLSSSHQPHDS